MRMPYEYQMTDEDFAVRRKLIRGLGIFYGCVGLGIIVLAATGDLVPPAPKNAVVRGPTIDVPVRPPVQTLAQSDTRTRGR